MLGHMLLGINEGNKMDEISYPHEASQERKLDFFVVVMVKLFSEPRLLLVQSWNLGRIKDVAAAGRRLKNGKGIEGL